MLLNYLKETYGYNEPIFINEIRFDSLNDNSLRQSFKRMVKSGELERFDTGIYYIPNPTRLLKKSYLDPMKVVTRKYIKNQYETYGYFSGAFLANQLGMTTQMPAVMEIVTNKEATKGRMVTLGGQSVRLRRPSMPISTDNAELLQFLDAVSLVDKYAELSMEDSIRLLREYSRRKNFTRLQLSQTISTVTGTTAKKLIDWEIIYDFA